MTGKERRPDDQAGATYTTGRVDTHNHNPDPMLRAALEYAAYHWEVFPLRGKTPAIPNPHPKGSVERQRCKGECGLAGHGVLDATLDADLITTWWTRYPAANIGGRVPVNMFLLDIDPRNGGLDTITRLQDEHEPLPETLTTISGRGDGGRHLFYRRPPGTLTAKRVGDGLDIKTHSGYVVLAPSIHPDSGEPYIRIDRPVAAPPLWLVELITPKPAHRITPPPRRSAFTSHLSGSSSGSIADDFSANKSWADVLEPHHWKCLDADPDADGARWLHPTATSACSATIRNGCLFVWSTSTDFEASAQGDPHGYNRFHAYAVLNHGGNMSAAAHALRAAVST